MSEMSGVPVVPISRIDSIHRPMGQGVPRRQSLMASVIAASGAKRRNVMGKYLVGWLLGVPVIVLVIIYFFMH